MRLPGHPHADNGIPDNITYRELNLTISLNISSIILLFIVMAAQTPEVLLILMPWEVPSSFTENLPTISPGIEVITHLTVRGALEVPVEISQDVWDRVTVLFTWNEVPSKEQAPKLQYVQLLSAGCNHMMGTPIFDETDVVFCTANGVHP